MQRALLFYFVMVITYVTQVKGFSLGPSLSIRNIIILIKKIVLLTTLSFIISENCVNRKVIKGNGIRDT